MKLSTIAEALSGAGLMVRGGFHPLAQDRVPEPAGTVVLVGNVGPAMWRSFTARVSLAERTAPGHPLDEWTRRVVGTAASDLGATPLYPFDGPPYWPFQQWARRAEPVHPSPIGPLIHPQYGLWHGYRAALVFAESLALPPVEQGPSPCTACDERPCLSACPVDAMTPDGFAAGRCLDHLNGPKGDACRELACLARRACPVGRSYAYGPEQSRFHMDRFAAAPPSFDEVPSANR